MLSTSDPIPPANRERSPCVRRILRLGVFSLAVAILPGCVDTQVSSTPVDASSSVLLDASRSGLLSGKERLPGEFLEPSSVRELSDGRIIVADPAARRLFLVHESEGTVTEVGRPGPGPGEFRVPTRLVPLSEDRTLLLHGDPSRVLEMDGGEFTGAARMAPPGALGLTATGDWVSIRSEASRAPATGPASTVVVSSMDHGPSGQPLDTILSFEGQPSMFERRDGFVQMVRHVLWPVPVAAVGPNGWLATVEPQPYRVTWRTQDGQVIEGPILPGGSADWNDEDWERAALDRGLSLESLRLLERPSTKPPFLPPARGSPVFFTPDGLLLVKRLPSLEKGDRACFDLFDAAGERIGVVQTTDASDRFLEPGRDAMYLVRSDADGFERLYRVPWDPRVASQSASCDAT